MPWSVCPPRQKWIIQNWQDIITDMEELPRPIDYRKPSMVFVSFLYKSFRPVVKILLDLWRQDNTIIRLSAEDVENCRDVPKMINLESFEIGANKLFFLENQILSRRPELSSRVFQTNVVN